MMNHSLTRPASILAVFLLAASTLDAGPYAPAAGKIGSTAIPKDEASFIGWVKKVESYAPGSNVDEQWKDLSKALGAPGSDVYDIVSLGRGGNIVLSFDKPIADGEGWDFAVFENGFADGYLELAYVEVSSDGVNFVRFPSHSLTPTPVGAYANNMDATNISGLAGKYRLGFGTPFDLSVLAGQSGLDINWVKYVRLVDIVGDGSCRDSFGNIIFDPYPTIGSAGFDLDAVGVMHFASLPVPDLRVEYTNGTVTLRWQGRAGVSYLAQRSTDLINWNSAPAALSGVDGEMTITRDAPDEQVFYRVVTSWE